MLEHVMAENTIETQSPQGQYKEIVCHGGEVALVDPEDYELLSRFKWSYNGSEGNKYVRAGGDRKSGQQVGYYMHRLVVGGKSPDHINFNTLDNRKQNLRIATKQENNWHQGKPKGSSHGPCTSKYKGVSKYVNTGGETLWRVLIKLTAKGVVPAKFFRANGFRSEVEAAKCYNAEIVKHRGKWSWLNTIPEEQ
jgi:hypothetical protein